MTDTLYYTLTDLNNDQEGGERSWLKGLSQRGDNWRFMVFILRFLQVSGINRL